MLINIRITDNVYRNASNAADVSYVFLSIEKQESGGNRALAKAQHKEKGRAEENFRGCHLLRRQEI